MAASIKISELNSLTNLTDVDLFLVSDMETGTSKKVSYSDLKSNVTTDVSSALTSLQSVVAQNKTDAETLVETVRGILQAAIDANTATVEALDIDIAPETLDTINELAAAMGDDPNFLTTLQSRLDAIEGDNATQAELDAAIQSLTISIGTLAGDSEAADTALGNRLTTVETSLDNLDIDFAPETLNSINELAAAMGDDPAFLTTLQNRVTTIENDNATQTELDAAIASLQADVDQNETDSDAADAALSARITTLETDTAADEAALTAYKAYVDDMNLQLMLAYDTPTYIDTLFGG